MRKQHIGREQAAHADRLLWQVVLDCQCNSRSRRCGGKGGKYGLAPAFNHFLQLNAERIEKPLIACCLARSIVTTPGGSVLLVLASSITLLKDHSLSPELYTMAWNTSD